MGNYYITLTREPRMLFAEDGYVDPARLDAQDFLMDNPHLELEVDEDGMEIDPPDSAMDMVHSMDDEPTGDLFEGE
jgi:hypothetical protein